MHILSVLFLPGTPGSAEADVGWGGKLNGHLNGQLCREYENKNY